MVQKNRMNLIAKLSSKTKWLGVFAILIIGYALITVYNGLKDEVLHNDLCEKEQQILSIISVGNIDKAKELLKELEHPSDASAPLISRDSIVSWKTYWVAKRNYLEQQLIEGKSIQNNQK
jgi:hypothetical protein